MSPSIRALSALLLAIALPPVAQSQWRLSESRHVGGQGNRQIDAFAFSNETLIAAGIRIDDPRTGAAGLFVSSWADDGALLRSTSFSPLSAFARLHDAVVDPAGNVYLIGAAGPPEGPFPGPSDGSEITVRTAFVVKMSPSGDALFSTFFGDGEHASEARAATLAPDGTLYVTGWTRSRDFPTTPGVLQPSMGPQELRSSEAFIARMSPTGSVLAATYFGGNEDSCIGSGSGCLFLHSNTDSGDAVTVAPNGDVFVAGRSNNTRLPGLTEDSLNQAGSLFVLKIDSNLAEARYVARFGGGYVPFGYRGPVPIGSTPRAISLSDAGALYIAGFTFSAEFPTTENALQPDHSGGLLPDRDGFIARLAPDGRSIDFATYFGTPLADEINAFVVDESTNVLTVAGVRTPSVGAVDDYLTRSFIARVSADGSAQLEQQEFPRAMAGGGLLEAPDGRIVSFGHGVQTEAVFFLEPDDPTTPSIVAVSDAATLQPVGAVAPGELITVFGSRLGPTLGEAFVLQDGRVPDELSGVRVFINGVSAPVLYAQANQINAVVPFITHLFDRVSVEVMVDGRLSQSLSVNRFDVRPELFRSDGIGAAAVNQDGTINAPGAGADPGSVVSFYATGLGRMEPAAQDGAVADADLLHVAADLRLWVGSEAAEIIYAGSAPGLVQGVVQINARLPPARDSFVAEYFEPVQLEVNGRRGARSVLALNP